MGALGGLTGRLTPPWYSTGVRGPPLPMVAEPG